MGNRINANLWQLHHKAYMAKMVKMPSMNSETKVIKAISTKIMGWEFNTHPELIYIAMNKMIKISGKVDESNIYNGFSGNIWFLTT